jgi:hypothetical protein
VAFYICDLQYSLLRLSFGKQDQLPTPTWQWVTFAPIFGSFILYLLVNKIRVFVHLWMRQLIVVEGFHYLWFDFWHITYSLLKVFWRLAFLHRLWSYYCFSFLLSILYYTGIDNWSFPHTLCSCHPLKKHRLSTDNRGCWQ